jgi:anti-sigma factor RsiW
MNHQEALQEMAVERYLLGELSGKSLDSFEEHLFDCSECTTDVKAGVAFIDGARTELMFPRRVAASSATKTRGWLSWLTSPLILSPALAACLALLAVQTFVVQPRMRRELAQAQTPYILKPVVLANAGARGESVREVDAGEHKAFAVSVDVPTADGYSSYQASLYAPDGSLVGQTMISPEEARDAVLISVPTKAGLNSIVIRGLPTGGGSGDTLKDLVTYRFHVTVQK